MLNAKACAGVEGVAGVGGWSASACSGYNSSERQKAMNTESSSLRVVMGGTASTRAALQKQVTKDTLSEFIDSAPNGEAAVAYAFKPVWQILIGIYQEKCDASGSGSDACKHLQRAYNLNAAYEGWAAFGCRPEYTSNGHLVQHMRVVVPSGNSIHTYACHVGKYGCNDFTKDCWHGTVPTDCWCYGPSCLTPGPIISGTNQHRPEIKRAPGGPTLPVDSSCYLQVFPPGCKCDVTWNKDGGDTDIWTQSLASSRQIIV
jgi:hypothetical protein